MRYRLSILSSVIVLVCSGGFSPQADRTPGNLAQLPPIETVLLGPIELENVSIWVPAAKIGPIANMACTPREYSTYSYVLPASVDHTKTELCPKECARLLAEYTSRRYEQSLPLTRFGGWQWKYSGSSCQFESGKCELPGRGGLWENSWEATLTQSAGSICIQWTRIALPESLTGSLSSDNREQESDVDVRFFSSIRIRDGYPKRRQLSWR